MNIPFDPEKNKIEKGTLYLVSTPIGNLADLSFRAVRVLGECDFVAAEDTRNTGKLLQYYGISRPLVSYHEHNKAEAGPAIVSRLIAGESCALVTDAGTPGVSDPGHDLILLCRANRIPCTLIPGPCAAVNAVVLSGLCKGEFLFVGFVGGTDRERREKLESVCAERRPVVLYEAPHRLTETLSILCGFAPDREIALCRELTKINEEVVRLSVAEALSLCREKPPRGEYVLVLKGAEESAFWENMSIPEHVEFYLKRGSEKMEAMKSVAKDRNISKNRVYKAMIDTAGE